jgi:hypothetical protein
MIDNSVLSIYGYKVRDAAVPESTPNHQYVPDFDVFWAILSNTFMTVFGYYSTTRTFAHKYSPFKSTLNDRLSR